MSPLTGQRITIVGINYAPETTGIAPYTTALARALDAAGAHVHVVTGLPHYPQWAVSDARYAKGSIFRERDGNIEITRCRHFVPAKPDLLGRLRMEATFLARAVRIVGKKDSDLILTVTPSLAGLAAGVLGRRGRPVGSIVHDLTGNAAQETGSAKAGVGSAISWAEHALLRRCRRVGVIATEFGSDLAAAGVEAEALVDVPNFTHIEPAAECTAAARSRLGWDADRFTVVHTGNMGAKQGLLSVVAAADLAAAEHLDVDFVLMGDGNQREALEAAAQGVPRLRIVPLVSAADYPLVLAAADVLLVNELPGVRQMSLPSKLTSYAAAGKPILAAVDPAGITGKFLRDTRLGHVVPSGDAQALLQAVRTLSNDSHLTGDLADASTRVFHSHYDRASAYRRYVDFAVSVAGLPAIPAVTSSQYAAPLLPAPRAEGGTALERVS